MFLIGVLVITALIATAWAAEVSGKWVGKADNVDITLTLKVSGNTLSGTINNPLSAGETPINDGKVNGDEITFSVNRILNENEVKVVWKGKATGSEIKFKREIAGQAGSGVDIVAKKVK
jgi:PKD repeat protein